jgi:trigger factor
VVAEKQIEYLEKSQAKITITVNKDDAQKKYGELLNHYTKEARIPGFRPGKVPPGILEGKYGSAIKSEAFNDVVQSALEEVLPGMERRALLYSRPTLVDEEKIDLNFDNNLNFSIVIDVEPLFSMPAFRDTAADSYTITVNDDDINTELERLRQQNALAVEKNGPAAAGDIVTANYAELNDEGNELPETRREGFTFTVGEGNTFYEFDDDIVGMTKDEEKVIEKSYDAAYKFKDLAGRSVRIKTKVTSVKEKKVPELDDDFAQDINEKFQTLAELRNDIKEKLQANANESAKNKRFNDILKILTEKVEIDLPESMIEAENGMRFRNFARQSGFGEENLLKMLGGNMEALSERWRDESIASIKSRLILDRIAKDEGLKVSEEEINAEAERMSKEYAMSLEELKKQFGGSGFNDYIESNLLDRKTQNFLIENTKTKNKKELSLAEFVNLMQAEEKAEQKKSAKEDK